ncbi:MAG: hypothetical protein JWM99_5238, partial [Verrucomicrobiales bacterium]|nr:hypothetical protein [Verrucomicrobiales bacterium]
PRGYDLAQSKRRDRPSDIADFGIVLALVINGIQSVMIKGGWAVITWWAIMPGMNSTRRILSFNHGKENSACYIRERRIVHAIFDNRVDANFGAPHAADSVD